MKNLFGVEVKGKKVKKEKVWKAYTVFSDGDLAETIHFVWAYSTGDARKVIAEEYGMDFEDTLKYKVKRVSKLDIISTVSGRPFEDISEEIDWGNENLMKAVYDSGGWYENEYFKQLTIDEAEELADKMTDTYFINLNLKKIKLWKK